jgi:hypothetical protein
LPSKSSARYEPSCPVMPVIRAVVAIAVVKSMVWPSSYVLGGPVPDLMPDSV